jgi:hypothetical protein
MEMSFDEKLEFGKIAEKEIESYFMNKDYNIIRSYDYVGDDNKSPKMFSKKINFVLPDLDISKNGKRFWVECKHYTHTPLNRKYNIYVHGIKKRHYNHYLNVQNETGNLIYLFIKEIEHNCILYAQLDQLKTYDCQCGRCNNNCLIYFNREDFKEIKNDN